MTAFGSIAERQLLASASTIADISYTPASRYHPSGSFPLSCPACEAVCHPKRKQSPRFPVRPLAQIAFKAL
jgi:hypothetical protein